MWLFCKRLARAASYIELGQGTDVEWGFVGQEKAVQRTKTVCDMIRTAMGTTGEQRE